MELKVLVPIDERQITPINWNMEEVKQWVSELVAQINNQIFTDQTIPEAKEARAKLNALSKKLTAWRMEVTAPYLSPVDLFKAQVNEVKDLIDEASGRIATVVNDYTARKQEEKREEIEKVYKQQLGQYAELVPLSQIFNPKWLNATYPIKTVEKDLFNIAMRIIDDLAVITQTYPDERAQVEIKAEYFKTLNLAVTLSEYKKKQEYRAYLERLNNEPPKDEIQADTSATTAETKQDEQPTEEPKKVVLTADGAVKAQEQPKEKTYTLAFSVTATKAQLVALKAFFEENEIEYTKISKE